MNKCLSSVLLVIVMVSAQFSQSAAYNKSAPTYITRIIFPTALKNIPTLYGYYKGYKVEFDKDYCIIPEDEVYTYFPIIITQEVNHELSGNNIRYLARIPEKPCRLFHVSFKDKQWSVEEEDTKKLPIKIPENALVLLLNPDHVDALQEVKTAENTSENVLNLPSIHIKPTVTEQELNATSIYTLLAGLDSNAIHTSIDKKLKKERSTVVLSMRTNT
jgi:hypothetical protein